MNLPNKLTLLRVALVPVFMIFMYTDMKYSFLIGLAVFAIAAFTDSLDGHIARKYNLVTDFGKFMDPLADKVLTTIALIYLCKFGLCHEIVICIVLVREFAVSGIRLIAASNPNGGKVIAAGMLGKTKTVFQMIAIMLGFLGLGLFQMGTIVESTFITISTLTNILMWLMSVLTVISGMQYIIPNFDLIKNAK